MIDGVILTPLRQIPTPGGDVWHAMKRSGPGYCGFGEAYFSTIEFGAVKAWKCHQQMTSNLVVPHGKVRFVLGRDLDPAGEPAFQEIILSPDRYFRLTIPPGIWFGFQGLNRKGNLVLNLADIEHDPAEAVTLPQDAAAYAWGAVE